MIERSLTPSITVTIGHHTRIYFAFVTTAPAELDSPATVTLHAAIVCGRRRLRGRTDHARSRPRGRTPARLVLVDAMELAWQRAKCRGHQHLLLAGGSRARRPQHAAALALATASGLQPLTRSRHDSQGSLVGVNRSPRRRAFQEVTSWSSRSFRTTKATRPANSRMPSCISPTALLDGLKLIGFAVWERRSGSGRNVTFPARQYVVNGDRRSFALLRPVADAARAGTRARSRAAGIRRVRGDGHGGRFVDCHDPDAAIVAASGIAGELKRDPIRRQIMANVESSGGVKLGASFASPSGKTTLTDIEVANRLGVSRFTVRSWRLKGVGPRFLKMGRAVRYRPQDVDDYERQALVETQTVSDHGPM